MADKKKAEPPKSAEKLPSTAKTAPSAKTASTAKTKSTEKTATLQATQPVSTVKTTKGSETVTAQPPSQAAPPENGGYVTRDQERSWFKRVWHLSWSELKRYRKNIPYSVAIHATPLLTVLCVYGMMRYLKIDDLKIATHTATHIAAMDEFPLHGERSRSVRVYFDEDNMAKFQMLKDVKQRFEELGIQNDYKDLVKKNILTKEEYEKHLNIFVSRNMSYLFHVTEATDKGFEYKLLTPEWVLHGDLLPPQGAFAYPSAMDAIPLRDGYISEVAMLLNEAFTQILEKKEQPTARLEQRTHTTISPMFNYPIHLVLDLLLYLHATLQIMLVIRMVTYIVEEKESGLKTLLRTMGISSVEYYVTHALVYYVLLMINSLVLFVPICILIRFYFFGSVILGLLAYNMCMVMFGLMISTLFTARQNIGIVILALCAILHLETFLTTPSFELGRGILSATNFVTAFHYYMSSISHAYVLGLHDLPLISDISMRMFGILALVMMIVDCVILLCVVIYLTIVYPGGQERGAPWYFLFTSMFRSNAPLPRNIIEDQNWTRQAETGKRCIIFDGVDVESRLEAVSFECYADQVLGIYGHKNSGRSTLLRLAAMIQKPDAGSVFIMEDDMVNMNHLNIVGFMDSTTAPLFEHLNVLEHMELFARLRLSDEEEPLLAILKCLELDEEASVSSLNASMKRRLQLGLAYTGSTKIMILDQPTEGCDLYTRTMIRDFIAANKAGRTTIGIFSTASETDALSDRIALIARGYVLSCGSLDWMIETFGGFTSVLTIYPKEDYFTEVLRTKLKTFFTQQLPDANIVVDVGHNFTVLVKNEMTEQIGEILEKLDRNPEEWGMSYAEVQRLTVERMYSMLDHSEATEDSLQTDRAYVQEIERILTSPRFSLFSLVGSQINVVAKRKMLFTMRFMLNLFTQMTAFALLFLLCLFLLAFFAQTSLTPDMDVGPSVYPRMRLVGTKDAVAFAESIDLKAEVRDAKDLEMSPGKNSDWLFKYPAPLIGIFDNGTVVNTMSMASFRMGKLFATTLADNYRLRNKGKKDMIKFKVVSLLLAEKYMNNKHFYGVIPSRPSKLLAKITALEEVQMVSGNWLVWLFTCFCLAFSLSLCSLFPAYEASSGILRHMRVQSDGTPTVVYWVTVAVIDLCIHLLILTVCCFGFIYYSGPPGGVGWVLIYLGWIGAFLSCVPVVYLVAGYVAIPVKVFSIVMILMLWLPFCVVAAYYFVNISMVSKQFALMDDSAVKTLLLFSPVHSSALLTTFIPCLFGQHRYTDKIVTSGQLIESVRDLIIFCWAHAPAWFILLIIASKSLRKLLSKMYYMIAITEFNEPPEFQLPKMMAIANGAEENDESTDGNAKKKTSKTGEEKGYDQLPGLKNRDIIVAKKDLERIANNTVYDNLAHTALPGGPGIPQRSMMKSIRRDNKTMMGKLKPPLKPAEEKKKTGEVDVEPGAAATPTPATAPDPKSGTTPVLGSTGPSDVPTTGDSAPGVAGAWGVASPAQFTPQTPADSEKKKSFSKKGSNPSAKGEKKEEKKASAETPPKGSDSMKKVKAKAADAAKNDPPKTEEKKDGKDAAAAAKAESTPAAVTPATPATPAAKKEDKKESKKESTKTVVPGAAKADPSTKNKRSDKKEPVPSTKTVAPAAQAKVEAPKPGDKKPEEKKEPPKTDDKNKATAPAPVKTAPPPPNAAPAPPNAAPAPPKAAPAPPKTAPAPPKTDDKNKPSTPTKEQTKETQGVTPAPTPKNGSKKRAERTGAGKEDSDHFSDSDAEPDDVVVLPSLCCGGSTRGSAGAETKPTEEATKTLLPQPPKHNTLKTLTQKFSGPGVGTGVGADGMTMMARSRLTLSLHQPNEASKQRRMVKLDAPAELCEEDGVNMYDVYVNHKRSPQQFRLEGAITNIKRGSSVVVFGDAPTSAALLDVLSGDAIATRGQIAVAGKEHKEARIASIRDHMALPDFLTVREHLEQTASSYGIRYMQIVDRLLELVGITDKEHWIIKDLQTPDRLLVSLCSALMNRPHLIVLDEPISALCPTSSLTMWYTLSIIRNLWGTVVMTQTRSPMEVEMLASHILLTQPRVVCDVLQPYDIKQRYLTQLFVRVALRQGADKATISAIMISQLQAREYRTEARSEEVLSFVVELASRKLNVAFKQVCGFLLNLPVSFTVSTLPLDCAFENGGR